MMRKILLVTLIISLFALPILAAEPAKNTTPGQPSTSTPAVSEGANTATEEANIAAIVNGQKITLEELDQVAGVSDLIMQFYQVNPQFTQLIFSTEAGQELLNEYRKQQLDQYVVEVLLTQEVKKQGLEMSDEQKEAAFRNQVQTVMDQNQMTEEDLLNAIKQQYGFQTLDEYKDFFIEEVGDYMSIGELQKNITSDVTLEENAAQEYYDANLSNYQTEEKIRARHILVETEEEAQELLAKLDEGADFAELAKEFSTGPTNTKGGDLGYFTREDVVDAFADAAFALEIGEISGVVESPFGYHVIKLEDRKPAHTSTFEEVREEITNKLLEQMKQELWDEFVTNLREEAKVEIKL